MSKRNINSCTEATTLIPCHLKITHHTVHNVTELASCLAEVFDSHEITGIVWATNGTCRLRGIKQTAGDQRPSLDVERTSFDLSRIYEIRAWQVIDSTTTDISLAHEFRWANGLPSCELRLFQASEGDNLPPCELAHYISYIQHTDQPTATEPSRPKQISAFEYIKIDADTGNMTVVDQLFTGNWHSQLT